ncbi:tyramine beta-hydroxylase [Anthonomus grandis grandis]|uniref:tyramine beta-hydroxylase n=1 Tax=Anthonomus grandis grandis TaxID=2921223 RepID=UPI002165E355|nr:tyramine beta-hydroxylase [Anthonomus grandis grandis]
MKMLKNRKFLVVLALCVLTFRGYVSCEKNDFKVFNISLNGDRTITLHWIVDYSKNNLAIEIHLPSQFTWFAFGFSNRGEPFPADYCLLWKNLNEELNLVDVWANEKGVIELDRHQDCIHFRHKETTSGITKFTFIRKFDTCDNRDYIIQDGTTHIVWSKGAEKFVTPKGLNISTLHKDSGMSRVTLLKNVHDNGELPPFVQILDLLTNEVQVPAVETTYWCKVFKLPHEFKKKHHIYQYEANIQDTSEGLVHHMELFHCEANANDVIPLYSGPCDAKDRPPKTQICKRVLAAWAMGALPFTYPEEAALPLGGKDFNQYVMLEVHYNNPGLISGVIDSSGIRFYVSDKLRKMDAGIIELGLEYTDKMAIPPGQNTFSLTGYCISSCTSIGLPAEGITVFGSQLHTHLTGVRVYTRHFDAYGRELPELDRDNHFSTHFQEIRRLKRPVKVLPGHVLMTHCDYDTLDRKNVTLGGFSISDEMCVNYIHYYPRAPLEVCKSSISDQALNTFFTYMNEWEDQQTSMFKPISENYNSIHWNKMRIQLLNEVYHEAPLSMQCNMSNGDRFPGYWENAPLPVALVPLPPPSRNCKLDERK